MQKVIRKMQNVYKIAVRRKKMGHRATYDIRHTTYETLKHPLFSLSFLIVLLVGLNALMPAAVEAQNAQQVCDQILAVDPSASCTAGDTRLNTAMENIVNILSYAIGVISVIVILIGAIMYSASTGDPQKTKRAKDAILYAIVGLVVAVLGQAIVRTVLGGLE